MEFIDIQTYKALNLKAIMDMIVPSSILGRNRIKQLRPFTTGEESQLASEYQRLQSLSVCMEKNESFSLSLIAYLSKFEDILPLLNNLKEEKEENHHDSSDIILQADELQQIKHFVFYYELVRKLLMKHGLNGILAFPELNSLFARLDPEKLNSPVFSAGRGFSTKITELKAKLLELHYQYQTMEQCQLRQARESLNLNRMEKKLVVSRSQKKLLDKINNTGRFKVDNENFANITFSLRPSEEMVNIQYQTDKLKRRIEEEEKAVRHNLTVLVAGSLHLIVKALNIIAELDYLTARAVFAKKYRCIIPVISTVAKDKVTLTPHSGREGKPGKRQIPEISFKKAVNLYIKKTLEQKHLDYQPIDISFDEQINIITGANMAGKSTLLQTAGQLIYLVSMGVPLPCEKASVTLVDFIYSSRMQEEDFSKDLSSFAAEIVSLSSVVKSKKGKGLFLIDEFGRGTNPVEGEAIALSVLDFFAESDKRKGFNDIVISVTHFPARHLTHKAGHFKITGILPEDYEQLLNDMSNIEESSLDQLHRRLQKLHQYMNYQPQKIDGSYTPVRTALKIAEILGVDEDIIGRAKRYIDLKS